MHLEFIKSDIKLTIGILVSNRKKYIRNVMEGIKPLLKQLPCELIAVDTKGEESDGSIEIVREYTEKVYPFVWCNDFAAARNVCLEHARGEWFLFLDDDEWFEDVQELISFFTSAECESFKSGVFHIRNYHSDEKYSIGVVERLVRRTRKTRFVGKVHEHFNEVYSPRKFFTCEITHMGYVFADKEAEKKHQERNLSILEKMLMEEGEQPKTVAQFIQEYLRVDETVKKGLAFAKEYLEKQRGTATEKDKNVQWILSVIARRYEMDKQQEELFSWVEYAKGAFWCSPLTKLAMAGVAANAAAEQKDFYGALQYALEFVKQRDWLVTHEEEKNSMIQLDLPVFLAEEYYFLILRIGTFSANQLGQYSVAMELWNRFPWKREGFDREYYRAEMMRTVQGLRGQQEEKSESMKLTIGILVSNRKQYIREVMESIKPLLTQIPCELIAVDTKGAEGDGSIDIVREYTDKIYPFTWCNDFSAARNICLKHARGEWFMYLDDDECFENVQEIVEFFQSGEYRKYKSGYYYVRDLDKNGCYSTAIVGRMVHRTGNTRFVGRIHETFNEIQGPSKQFSCYVKHYGYMFANEDAAKAHQIRNVSILREELKTTGETPRICAQLVQELLYLPETQEDGFEFAMEVLARHKEKHWQQDSCAQWIMLATIRYFNRNHDYSGAVNQVKYLETHCFLNEMTWLAISGTMANLAMEQNDFEAMLGYVQRYLDAWNWKIDHEEQAMVQMNLDMPKYTEQKYYQRMVKLREVATECLQKKKQPKLIKSDIKLTVGILVSNHKQYIRKVMEGLKPLLDAVPSELVVIDTMGEKSDGSIDIVREYTDRIYPFTWCNDFSAARNFCLDHARGEWFMYQDDDEWFENVQEFIDFFNSEESEKYYSGYYYTRDYLPGGQCSVGIAGRIIRRTEATRFVGRVHENFNETFAPNKEFSCFTHHYGYAYENEEQKAAKQKRNIDILSEEIKDKGLTPGRAAQMVQELFSRDETREEGLNYCKESLKILKNSDELMHSCSQWLIVALARYYILTGNTKMVLEQAEEIKQSYTLTPIAEMVLAANVVPAAASMERYDMVAKYAEIYFVHADWRAQHEEEALLQVNLDFPRYLTEEYYYNIVHMAAATANHMGEYEKANSYWRCLPFNKQGFDGSRYALDMNRTMQGLKEQKDKQLLVSKLKDVLALLDSVSEACEYLRSLIISGNVQEQKELFAGMQEAAITVGTSLDRILGEGTEEVSLLEEYCEQIWLCSNEDLAEKKLVIANTMCQLIFRVKKELDKRT